MNGASAYEAGLKPLALVCYLCGREFGTASLEIHQASCIKKRTAEQKLLDKELIAISGRKEDAVGKPLLYATAKNFMDYLGINSPDDLPELKDISNIEIVVRTNGSDAEPGEPEGAVVVDMNGSLKEANGG